MPFLKAERLAAIIYAVATPLAIFATFVFEYAAIALNGGRSIDLVGGRPLPTFDWLLIAINTLPSILAGTLVFGTAALIVHRRVDGVAAARWLRRCVGPLFGVVFLAVLIAFASTAGAEFWLFGLPLIWPLIALVAGLAVEYWVAARSRSPTTRAAA